VASSKFESIKEAVKANADLSFSPYSYEKVIVTPIFCKWSRKVKRGPFSTSPTTNGIIATYILRRKVLIK
jgi:hypothetical protein